MEIIIINDEIITLFSISLNPNLLKSIIINGIAIIFPLVLCRDLKLVKSKQ